MLRSARVLCNGFACAAVLVALEAHKLISEPTALSISEQKALSDFTKNTKAYEVKEHSLAASRMKPTTDVAKLVEQRKQIRDAMQQARPNAKQGDFFNSDVATAFRGLLAQLLNGPDGAKIKSSLNHSEPGAPTEFKVNEEFPNENGQPIQSVPPTVLKVLPALPKGLEYCIAGRSLALRDSSANMVVDYLPDALP